MAITVELKVEVHAESAGVWVGTTVPLAITMRGRSPEHARDRALKAAMQLLGYHAGRGSQEDFTDYLNSRGVPYEFEDAPPWVHRGEVAQWMVESRHAVVPPSAPREAIAAGA